MNNARLLTAVLVLQGLTLMTLWSGNSSALPQAQAQTLDPGAQRLQIVDELRQLNGRMDTMVGIVERGELQVRVVVPDESNKERK